MPKPVVDKPLNAYLYPEGGPGRQLKARLRAGEVLVGGMIAEYVRPSLVKCFQQAGCDFIYIEFEHGYFDLTALADTVQAARCLLYTSPSPRDGLLSRMPSSA